MNKLIVSLVLCLFFCSCFESKKDRINRITREWIGKEFLFNESLSTVKDSCYAMDSVPYFLLYYIDSLTCVTCRSKAWESMIIRLEDSVNHKIPNCLVVSPGISSKIEIVMNGMGLSVPWLIDYQSKILRINQMPENDMFKVMLLDRDYKVVALGNPITSKSIQKLFLKRMLELEKAE